MRRSLAVIAMAVVPVASSAQFAPASAGSVSFVKREAGWSVVPFVCDGTNRDRVLVIGAPGAGRQVELLALARPGSAPRRATFRLGAGDAGMGQIWYPLLDATGRVAGAIHALNPGMVEPGATTPAVVGIRLGRDTIDCRFAAQTRVLGVTPRRSIQVVRTERAGYRYTSYDHDADLPEIAQPWGGRDTRASLTIDGGRLVDQSATRRIYQFVNRGFVYRVMVSLDPARAGGGIEVSQRGLVVLSEPFGAYTAAQ